jgi:hypothetical protein
LRGADQGVHGYLASVASIYGAVWSVRRGAAPSALLPPSPPPPAPASDMCVDCQQACVAPPTLPSGDSMCSNITGRWIGSWTGSYIYSVLESSNHEVTFCSDFKRDCWSSATGPRLDRSVKLTFNRCKPFANVSKAFKLDPSCGSLTAADGKYTRLK